MDHQDAAQFGPSAGEEAHQDGREQDGGLVDYAVWPDDYCLDVETAAEAGCGLGAGQAGEGKSAFAERAGYPTGFGRGWIPLERDIGLPKDDRPPRSGDGPGAEPDPGLHSYHFTAPRRSRFLSVLAQQGSVHAACVKVGISRQAAYLARRRDAMFRAGWEAALIHARAVAEEALANRALDGVREQVWHRGELVGEKVRFDTRLLLAHLARLDARAADPQALAHAERFDEILALVAGETYPAHMADEGDGAHEPDPFLPMARHRYPLERACAVGQAARRAAEEAEAARQDYVDERQLARDAEDRALWAAQDVAAVEWDRWAGRVGAVADALAADEEPVVTPWEDEADMPAQDRAEPGASSGAEGDDDAAGSSEAAGPSVSATADDPAGVPPPSGCAERSPAPCRGTAEEIPSTLCISSTSAENRAFPQFGEAGEAGRADPASPAEPLPANEMGPASLPAPRAPVGIRTLGGCFYLAP